MSEQVYEIWLESETIPDKLFGVTSVKYLFLGDFTLEQASTVIAGFDTVWDAHGNEPCAPDKFFDQFPPWSQEIMKAWEGCDILAKLNGDVKFYYADGWEDFGL